MVDTGKILAECKKNLERGRAVATGIGLFAVFIEEKDRLEGQPRNIRALLRRRPTEEDTSLISAGNFAGKWEMIGGGVDLADLEAGGSPYRGAIYETLVREIREEAGLELQIPARFDALLPAWLFNNERGVMDLAFAIAIPKEYAVPTPEFDRKIQNGELRLFSPENLGKIEIVSPRSRFLINAAFEYVERHWPAPPAVTPHP